MNRIMLALLLTVGVCSNALSANTHGTPNALQEMEAWMGDLTSSYVHSGCLPVVPSSSITLAAFACSGYVKNTAGRLVYVTQPAQAVTLTNTNGRYFVALTTDTSTAVASWTRQAASHYIWQRYTGASTTLPATPDNAQIVLEITVAGSVITVVTDYRTPASYARMGACLLTDPLFGAVGNGTTDDTVALQAAANDYACKVVAGRGTDQYRVTSTLTITRHFRFMGLGAGPGGAISPDTRFQGMAINHDFNGTLLYFPGILNNVITPVGFELENMVLRQVYGNNSAAAGKAIDILATTSNFRPTWVKVHNVNIEQDSTADSWTWGIYIDGTAVTTGGIGARDNFFSNMRVVSGANSTGSIGLYTATNARLNNILINGSNCDVVLSGVSGNTGQLSHMNGIQGTCGLTVDWATGNSCYDCGFNTLTVTANATSYNYRGSLSGAPTIALGAVAVFVESAGAMYFSGDNNRYYKYKALDGNQTRLGLDVNAGVSAYINWQDAGTEKWAMGKAADNSFFFNGASSLSVMTVGTDGTLTTKRGTAKNGRAPTYGVSVTIDASLGDIFVITVTDNSNFTITTTNNITNQVLTVIILNSSGGAMGTITWDASIFRLAGAFVNPADTFQRAISFRCSGTKQQEISRNAADVSGG